MKINLYLLTVLFLAFSCNIGRKISISDFTPPHSFSQNCEGPAVDRKGQLYVVNYQNDGTVGRFQPDGKAELFVTLPEGSTANAIRFDSRGDLLLADFSGHNILKIDPETKTTSIFCHDTRFNQPNDLCINRKDVIFASDPDWANSSGQLWRIDPNGGASLMESSMGTTNGIELSPNEKTLYVNESIQRRVWAYDVGPDGQLSNKRLFYYFDDHGLDGMKCDRRGNLYVARWGGGKIDVLSPAGKLINSIATQGKQVSNLAFGGPDGRTVYVTLQDRKCVETFRNPIPGKGW